MAAAPKGSEMIYGRGGAALAVPLDEPIPSGASTTPSRPSTFRSYPIKLRVDLSDQAYHYRCENVFRYGIPGGATPVCYNRRSGTHLIWCYTCNLPGSECDCPIPEREEE